MEISIKTKVAQNYQQVFEGFDERLFIKLKPFFIPLNLLRYDGCKIGDEVQLELGKSFFKVRWHAKIIDYGKSEEKIFFVDEGKVLPFFLKYWQHRHLIIKAEDDGAYIVDNISFTTPFFLFDYLMYPIFYWQFWRRKSIYKKVFS